MPATDTASGRAADYRVTNRVASLLVAGPEGSSGYPCGCTITVALAEIDLGRRNGCTHVEVKFEDLATITGTPDEVAPLLVGLLAHASGASGD